MVYLLQQLASICTLGSLYGTGSAEVPIKLSCILTIQSKVVGSRSML